jgi:hypothetical protein
MSPGSAAGKGDTEHDLMVYDSCPFRNIVFEPHTIRMCDPLLKSL